MKQITLQYVLGNINPKTLWNVIATPEGLSTWFADKVEFEDKKCLFTWGKEIQEAEIITVKANQNFTFAWEGNIAQKVSLAILTQEITKDVTLQITDNIDPDEEEEITKLWDKQVSILKRNIGV